MSDKLRDLLDTRPWLLADGATGTAFFAKGLASGEAPERWNFEQPDKVIELHREFLDAGSNIILTNTFGGNRNRLELHGCQDRCREINLHGVELARRAVEDSGRGDVAIAGSMGPTGELYQPLGPLSVEDGAASFAEQAEALAEGGVDVLWIETLSSFDELRAAVGGASSVGLPMTATFSFDSNGRTMMGVSPSEFVAHLAELPHELIAMGANCGSGSPDLAAAILEIADAAPPGTAIIAKSNNGIPEYVEGEVVYRGTPESMGRYACIARDIGARIIGGCCGSTAEHIAAMRRALESTPSRGRPDIERIAETLGPPSHDKAGAAAGDAPQPRRRARRRRPSPHTKGH